MNRSVSLALFGIFEKKHQSQVPMAEMVALKARIATLEALMGSKGNNGVAFVGGSPTDVSVNTGDTAFILICTWCVF